MIRPTLAALALALGAAAVTPAAARAETPALVAAFDAVCLAGHGDLARTRALADQNGWGPLTTDQPPNPFRLTAPENREKRIVGVRFLLTFGEGPFIVDDKLGMRMCAVLQKDPGHDGVAPAVRQRMGIAPGDVSADGETYGFTETGGAYVAVDDPHAAAAAAAGTLALVDISYTESSVMLFYGISTGPKK